MEEISESGQPRKHLTKDERLPKCYKDVEKVIRTVKSCQSNFKTVLANSRYRGSHFKKVYSMTVNVLKYYNYIQEIIIQTSLLEKEKFLKQELASILIYEIIFGKGYLPGNSKIVSIIQKYEKDIFNVHQILKSNPDKFITKEINVPRYVRVHTLVTTVAYVIKDFESLGFHQVSYENNLSEEEYLELVKNLEPRTFLVDFHFKDMLVFERSETLINLDIYKKGHIFLQDKASYIPVHALSPESGSAVLDACAAPGMKTIHIASKMKNKGILIACEKDKKRFESLKEMIHYGAVKIAKVFCKDFRALDPNDQAYSTVEYILLDPSCSGSGMVSRMDEVTDTEDSKNKERLMKLSGFQIILLKHALKFPSVKKVVYSTCSVHEEENENVVHEVLQQFKGAFKLVPVMPEWPERGLDNFEFGHLCLRTAPEKHLMNGFFVAMFERVENNGYGKDVRISGNKKFKTNPYALRDIKTDFGGKEQSIATSEWERNVDNETMSDGLNDYFDENNQIDENSLDLEEKKKHKSPQKQLHSFKNYNLLQNENFEEEVSTLGTLKSIETFDSSNENLGKELEMEFDHDSNVNKKHKKKKNKTREDSLKIHCHSNEELTNALTIDQTSILTPEDSLNEILRKELVIDLNNDSNVSKKHKKKKRKKDSVEDHCHSSEIMDNETNILTIKNTSCENLGKESLIQNIDQDSNASKKHKKKKHKTREDSFKTQCHSNEELTNALIINETSILIPEDSYNKNMRNELVIEDLNNDSVISKKHKKKKRKIDSVEDHCHSSEIMGNATNILTAEDTCENLGKEPAMKNIDHDSNLNKTHEEKQGKELTCEIMDNETKILTTKNTCENLGKESLIRNIDQDSNASKKHKKKKHKTREDSFKTHCHSNEELTNALIINETSILIPEDSYNENMRNELVIEDLNNDSVISKKHKKKKRKIDSVEDLCHSSEITGNATNNLTAEDTCKNLAKELVTQNIDHDSNVDKKHKKKKKKTKEDSVEVPCLPTEEFTNVLIIDENNTLTTTETSNEKLGPEQIIKHLDNDSNVGKKHKKKKKKDTVEILCQPSEQQTNEIISYETNISTFKEKNMNFENIPDSVENIHAYDASTYKSKMIKRLLEKESYVQGDHKDKLPLKGKKRKCSEQGENITEDSISNEQHLKGKRRKYSKHEN